MDKKQERVPFLWMEESNEPLCITSTMKRKHRPKKMEFNGWGSKPLIEFLDSIGKDTSTKLSQYDVSAIISQYVKENNLFHPEKKKRVLCDGRLHSLFGRKSVARIKIHDLLEVHFAENREESEDDFAFSSEEKEANAFVVHRPQKISSSDGKPPQKRKFLETPKSCFAAIISQNIKLVYLRRSLVQDLLKEPESFENKIVGSFVRVKTDPNDYFQKNSHQLLLVTGVKTISGIGDIGTEILLHVSNYIKDIHIWLLSDDNFSEEECEDLRQRMNDGLLKRPTIGKLEEKAQILHEDITKHWIVRELALLQNLIDRANEKGWRKELFEYLDRRQLLQTPAEQSRLLQEVPKVIAEEPEREATHQSSPDNFNQQTDISPRSIHREASDTPFSALDVEETVSTQIYRSTNAADHRGASVHKQQFVHSAVNGGVQWIEDKQVTAAQVIELSDSEDEEMGRTNPIPDDNPRTSVWHYVDPQGDVQGPVSLVSLKHWNESNYFHADFKIWKTGQTKDDAVLLSDILCHACPCKSFHIN